MRTQCIKKCTPVGLNAGTADKVSEMSVVAIIVSSKLQKPGLLLLFELGMVTVVALMVGCGLGGSI